MASDTLFRTKAPGIMNLLMADFPLGLDDTAAILGNIGHECTGFTALQEQGVSTRGGYGWPQWTAGRRDAYEAYCRRHNFDPASDTANYKYMFVELKGSHRAAIPAVKNAVGLEEKVKAFELVYEVAGVKAYDSRNRWANIALEAYRANPGGTIDVKDAGAPADMPHPSSLDLGEIFALLQPVLPLLLALVQRVLSDEKLRALVVPLVLQFLGIRPADPKAPGKVDPSRPGFLMSLIALAGAALGIDQGMLGGALGQGDNPTLAGSLAVIVPIITGAISLFGGGVPIAAVIKNILAAVAAASQGKPKP